MKIAILLPYKENFSPAYAGAVSLFVNDIVKESIYNKTIKIYGNTKNKQFLSDNYQNINFSKNYLLSSNYQYVETFIKLKEAANSDLIEVHNRPKYINQIKKRYSNKLFLYFHNDPLTMNGSKTISERINLLNSVHKIFFNSHWCRNRFFDDIQNINKFKKKTAICFQSSSKTKINFKEKKKIISFVGKLNRAKGYDIFGNAILKILDKHPSWTAKVYGDEPREKLIFKHKNLDILGFKDNKSILDDLKKISISVVCSKWDEPFGRTSLEAASRGSAVIISNKGGLPETTKEAIILKKLNSRSLYQTINELIINKKKLLSLQKKNYNSFKLTHSYVSKIIDNLRVDMVEKNNLNLFNIKKNKTLKIIHITNFNRRFNGRLQYNTGRRLNNGFIKLGHNVLTLSDRDILHENKNLLDLTGKNYLENKIIENTNNFKADCLILGHADAISLETLVSIKEKNKNLKICQWFLDPLGRRGPDYLKNNKRIADKSNIMDATFLTSCPSVLSSKIDNSYFIPNPADESFEILNNYEKKCKNDVFFAMSHGVHRGLLKAGKYDDRENFINKLKKKNKNIIFDIYGMNKIQPVWGDAFINAISNSNMAINLSRGEPVKYYSSDRIAQLMGNGLLTFIDKRTFFNDFFSEEELIFYNNLDDLSYKLNKYKKDFKTAKKIAKKGKKKYFKNFNSTIVADFILSKTLDFKSKNKFIWNE
jgi:glycosyltransferase involved in cell wall biosynthesis